MEKQKRKLSGHFLQAFTLTEVLITLAVIGVVAAMVMPSFSVNIQERTLRTSAKVTERKIMMAVEAMTNIDKMGGYKNTAEFVGQLRKHLNIAQVCGPNNILDCWEDRAGIGLENSANGDSLFGMYGYDPSNKTADYNNPVVSFVMPDGATVIMGYNTLCRTDGHEPRNCIVAAFDSNGRKNPNEFGKDMFLINSRHFHGNDYDESIDVSPERGGVVEVSGMCNDHGSCGSGGDNGGGSGGGLDDGGGENKTKPKDKKNELNLDSITPFEPTIPKKDEKKK